MDTVATENEMDDSHIIREVLAGRRDQFQELVNRYADKVYGVAWSRLGDRHLAEEVVQETFIQGFQQLHRLKDTDKFLPWISSIARNKAINFGMRFRNELQRRERWALEHAPADSSQASDADRDPVTKETLRETLASLNGSQRECLTLFYLQGKSVEEASKSLGITTGNFKTRLHRARAALRTKLEAMLETELNRFKPSDQVRHGIMAVVLAKSTSGTGLKAIGAWLPTIPFLSSLFLMVQFIAMIPGFLLAKWTMKQTLDNLKDQDGYRAKIMRANSHKIYWTILVLVLVYLTFSLQIDRLIVLITFYLIFLAYSVVYLVQFSVLKYQFPPTLYLCYGALLICMGIGMYDASLNSLIMIPLGFSFVLSGYYSKESGEGRFDCSIFLRISDLLRQSKPELPVTQKKSLPSTSSFINSFIGFLSVKNNLVSMRTELDGVRTWVCPVQTSGLRLMFAPFFRSGMSTLFFRKNGTIKAELGEKDRQDLIKLGVLNEGDDAVFELEQKVEVGVKKAWGYWSHGQNQMAKFALGYEPDEQTFHKPPERLSGKRFRWAFTTLLGILMVLLGMVQQYDLNWGTPFDVKRMREPNITESEAKAYVQDFLSDKAPSQVIRKRWLSRIAYGHVFPPVDWLTEENKQKIREYLETVRKLDAATIDFKRRNDDFTLSDLEQYGGMSIPLKSLFDLEFVKDIDWETRLSKFGSSWTTPDRVWKSKEEAYHIFNDMFQMKLAAYSQYIDLKQINFSKAQQWLVEMQCLDTSKDFAGYKKVDLKRVHGLFLGFSTPLHETWKVLSIMEMTGGLDLIDKEACIQGILSLHHGGGRFYLNVSSSRISMSNGASDTWRAFQSLRILNALDRVEDLADWKFLLRRPLQLPMHPGDQSRDFELNGHDWNEVEAFLMQQEFDAYLEGLR